MSAVLAGEEGDFEACDDKLVENAYRKDAGVLYQHVSFRYGIVKNLGLGD